MYIYNLNVLLNTKISVTDVQWLVGRYVCGQKSVPCLNIVMKLVVLYELSSIDSLRGDTNIRNDEGYCLDTCRGHILLNERVSNQSNELGWLSFDDK